MGALFGPAGNSTSFAAEGHKNNLEVPEFIKNRNLDIYEFQCGQGVRTNKDTALKFGAKAKENEIILSIHAPYYISLSSVEPEKRDNSINYILQTARLADQMGADRIIIHTGSCSKMSREDALELAIDTLTRARKAADDENLEHIFFCPETMGKINQLGTLEEVVALCSCNDRFIPCVDFGHLNARTFGGIKTEKDYEDILNKIENVLGHDRLKVMHSHFSKIEYSQKGGEVRHLTFEDDVFGPQFEPLMEIVAKKNLDVHFICESSGTQAEDAYTMKKYYNLIRGNNI